MKVLHILKSKPDKTITKFTNVINRENTATVVMLYEEHVDWPALVDKIFENDKVICWW